MEGPLSGAPGEERAYKRDPVLRLAAEGRPSLWDRRYRRPRAAYPGASNGPFAPCLALLRAGLAEPQQSPAVLVSSYLTVSPLPTLPRAVCFLWRFPRVTPGGRYPPRCPTESRLSSTPFPMPRPPGLLSASIVPAPG